jgi:hypothetical protein
MAGGSRHRCDPVLASALARGATLRAAAGVSGVSTRTAERRWADPEFRATVERERAELITAASGALLDGMAEAVRLLRGLLRDARDERVKLGAARTLLEMGFKAREQLDVEARLQELESLLSGGRADGGA